MAITDKKSSPPHWRCEDCGEIFSGRDLAPDVVNVDDAHDVFSKHRGQAENRCPKCGGSLTLRKPGTER
jgi:ribosomal protein L37AE/L43A